MFADQQHTLLIILALLQLADLYTTQKIILSGGKELNPIMKKLIDVFGLIPALIFKGALVAGAAFFLLTEAWMLPALVAFYCAIIIWNLSQP